MTSVIVDASLDVPDLPGEDHRSGVTSTLIPSEAIERLWDRLQSHHGHLLVLGAAGCGKTSALRLLRARSRESGVRVLTDPRSPLAPGDLLLLDDAHTVTPSEVRELCAAAHEVGARVVLASRPDSAWRRDLETGGPSSTISTTTLEPWGTAEVVAASGPDEDPTTESVTTESVARLLADTAGMPWLVTAAIRGDVDQRVLHRLRVLVDEDVDLLIALICGSTKTEGSGGPGVARPDATEVGAAIDRLTAAGLLAFDATVPLVVRRAVLRYGPQHRVAAQVDSTLDGAGEAGDVNLLAGLAEDVVAAGMRDARLAAVIERAADASLASRPGWSASRYRTAIEAGGDVSLLGVKCAEAQALAGDVPAALTSLDSTSPAATSAYLRVATTVSLLGWQPERAADLWRWAMVDRTPAFGRVSRATGAYALFGVGDPVAARELFRTGTPEAPSTEASLMNRLAEAISSSLDGDGRASLPALIEIASVTSGFRRTLVLPDHPAALAAVICLGSGDVAMAESILTPALADAATSTVDRSRLSALMGWVAMTTGRFDATERHLAGIDPTIRRDEPWLRALRIGLARRRDDLPELTRLWTASRGELLGHPEDLYALLPLGELGLAGARMRDHAIVDAAWGRAADLLGRVGDPPAWSATFHWYGVQAAILAERPRALSPHATALVKASGTSPYAARLANAARLWVAALGGRADASGVDSAARALGHVGQAWEGARLAAHAAARAGSKRESALLMECARDLRGELAHPEAGMPSGPGSGTTTVPGGIELTPREREVVELVLSGLTYREIGARLFLSAKTVEHHMARIKRRSDAATRGELLQQLALTLRPHR